MNIFLIFLINLHKHFSNHKTVFDIDKIEIFDSNRIISVMIYTLMTEMILFELQNNKITSIAIGSPKFQRSPSEDETKLRQVILV